MKKHRRYREKNPKLNIAICVAGQRVHDFLKGWGTYDKDGSVLWDFWRPIPKREIKRKNKKLPKILLPMIKRTFPELVASEIVGVQPMGVDLRDPFNPHDPYAKNYTL